MSSLDDILNAALVIPVIALDRVEDAAPLARALTEGGVRVLELTLRTPVALDALKAMKAEAPEAYIGMGTVRSGADVERSLAAGADFLVTPGTPSALADALIANAAVVLPGAATATEVMTLADRGFLVQKLFPAVAVGGLALLKGLAGPLPDVRFCPTGGITLETAPSYLALPNVACVGGTWLAPRDRIEAGDWAAIEAHARAASALAPRARA